LSEKSKKAKGKHTSASERKNEDIIDQSYVKFF